MRREYEGVVRAAEDWVRKEKMCGITTSRLAEELETLKNG